MTKLDSDIRAGRVAGVGRRLHRIRKNAIPRPVLTHFAALARRAGLAELGMRWLNPYVRTERGMPEPREEEIVEYAACLTRLGRSDEALALLEPLDVERVPRALFERAAAYVYQWDYRRSIPLLEAYLKTRGLSAYERLVAQVNLAGALTYERRYVAAGALLRGLLHAVGVRRLPLLWSNVLQYSAINFVGQKKLAQARRFLRDARKVVTDERSLDYFLVRKWEAIIDLVENPASEDARAAVVAIREAGALRGHWETIRDCDRNLALILRDETKFWRVYFGTPYASYRDKLTAEFPGRRTMSPPPNWIWTEGTAPPKRVLELPIRVSASDGRAARARQSTGTLNRALLALTSDLYRPWPISALFAQLYPGEIFHPESSPNRTHQVLNNLRAWLARQAAGVSISDCDGGYRLTLAPNWGVSIPLQKEELHRRPADLMFDGLRSHFGEQTFSSREAADLLRARTRTTLRLLKGGVEDGVIARSGGKSTARYRFVAR